MPNREFLKPFNSSTFKPLKKGWRWVKLGEVLKYTQYGISKKLNSERKGLPIVRMGNIEEGKLNLSEIKFVDLPWSEAKKYLLNIGDILFNRTNSAELVGKSAVFKQQGEYVFASYLIRLTLKPSEADPDFVNYIINSFIGKSYISNVSRRAIGQVNINAKEISEMPIPLPPLPEQKRIVAKIQELMQEVERAKAACEKQLEAAKALLAAYLRQVFESEEAKKWERKRLGEIFIVQQGVAMSPKRRLGVSPYPFLRTLNVLWGRVDLSTLDKMDFTNEEIMKFCLKPGDLLVCEGGEVGRTAIWRGELDICLYQNHIHRLRSICLLYTSPSPRD